MRDLFVFALRSTIELVLAPLAGSVAAAMFATLLASLLLHPRWADNILMAPTWCAPILVGAAASCLRNARRVSWAALFVWIIPALLALAAVLSEGWTATFGMECSDSECLAEFFCAVPFVFSSAYAVTALCIHRFGRRPMA